MPFNYQNFNEVFAFDLNCCHDEIAIQTIEKNRKTLEGLFLDRVLKMLRIKKRECQSSIQRRVIRVLNLFSATKLYPANDNKKLRDLHEAIVKSDGADHHKISILHYLLLDFDAPTGRREYSTRFEKAAYLPEKYAIYMKGLWHMDRLEFEVSFL